MIQIQLFTCNKVIVIAVMIVIIVFVGMQMVIAVIAVIVILVIAVIVILVIAVIVQMLIAALVAHHFVIVFKQSSIVSFNVFLTFSAVFVHAMDVVEL